MKAALQAELNQLDSQAAEFNATRLQLKNAKEALYLKRGALHFLREVSVMLSSALLPDDLSTQTVSPVRMTMDALVPSNPSCAL